MQHGKICISGCIYTGGERTIFSELSGQDKLMLFCVVNKKEIVTLKEKVDMIDPDAFVIVCDVREVHGEGFIEKK